MPGIYTSAIIIHAITLKKQMARRACVYIIHTALLTQSSSHHHHRKARITYGTAITIKTDDHALKATAEAAAHVPHIELDPQSKTPHLINVYISNAHKM